MSHPQSCKNPESCQLSYVEHLRGFAIASGAMPTRRGASEVQAVNIREKRWQRDMDAFMRLHREGHTPPKIDGSALREREGQTVYDITSRPVDIDYGYPNKQGQTRVSGIPPSRRDRLGSVKEDQLRGASSA